jgi:YhcG PDDEXK nuclease domain
VAFTFGYRASSIADSGTREGFAFVGSQYHLEVGGQDYFLDLLFYHLRLRCFVVVELKIEDFKPEFAGKRISIYRPWMTAAPSG